MMRYVPVDEAVNFSLSNFKLSVETEKLELEQLLKRIPAKEIRSPVRVPPTNRSAVDGFALCSDSVTSASSNNPIPLVLREDKPGKISCGEAVPISTGDPLPDGADAVVMLEDAEKEGNRVLIMKSVAKFDNVSRAGEDFEQGDIVLSRGTLIRPWHVASLSALGLEEVDVFRKLKVGIIATGSEVSEPGGEGFVFDSTSKLIAGYLAEQGYMDVKRYGIVEDDEEVIASVIEKAWEKEDIIITTGGTGPGSRDLCVKALQRVGGKILIRGIAMRPGRPTSVGELKSKPVFLLSGYPVAAFVGVRFLVLPFIEEKLGIIDQRLRFIFAKLTSRVFGEVGVESFIRVKLSPCGNELCADPIMLRGSGILSSLLNAGGFLRIPRNAEGYEAGEIVRIELV
ncbi:MAG: molybdenum cofactor biosynthesis protein [Fervidicoccus sp.]|nr:MAG: molybdenum cofactor biosynthesis protein [Fervidicoccus sp.]